jgi:hypothetical protein
MSDFREILRLIAENDLAKILIVAGIAFLFVALLGGFSDRLTLSTLRSIMLGIAGAVLLVLGIFIGWPSPNQIATRTATNPQVAPTQMLASPPTVVVSSVMPRTPTVQPSLIIVPPTPAPRGKAPCALLISQGEVITWQVGQDTIPAVQAAILRFDAKRPNDAGAFTKGTRIPSGIVVATNFDEQDGKAWQRYPVVPIVHSGSWGLFQSTGEYVAPNPGACMTIIP